MLDIIPLSQNLKEQRWLHISAINAVWIKKIGLHNDN